MNRILLAALAAAGLATGPVQAAPPLILTGPSDPQAQQSAALLVPVRWHGHHRHWHRHRGIGDLVRELEPDAEPATSAAAFGASQPASVDTARPWLDPGESGR